MAFVAGAFTPLSALSPGRDTWKVMVRVIRCWEMSPIGDPTKPYAMNLVLIDSQGFKIEAIIKKNLMVKFNGELTEGNVYKITYLHVAVNSGSFRATEHQYKIYFNGRTRVVVDSCDTIPQYGLTLKNSSYVDATLGESNFLIDIIGVVTGVSREKQYSKDGNLTRKIEVELTDDKGTVKCAFFGNYVDMVAEFMASSGGGLPIVVVQLAKIKTFRDDIVIQNVMNATKIYWNSNIPEISVFRDSIAVHGMDLEMPIREIDDGGSLLSLQDEFLKLFPRKSLAELHSTLEDGMFIVSAKVETVFEDEKWWYASCRCHKSVSLQDGLYFCDGCSTFVLEVTPRFRVKLEVSDDYASATLVLFDSDCEHIFQKPCKDMLIASKTHAGGEYPNEIKAIVGKTFLFKVEKSLDLGSKFEDSIKVRKICDDPHIIELFQDANSVLTPLKHIKSSLKETSAGEISGSSECMSEVAPTSVSLDDISPSDASPSSSSIKSVGRYNSRAKKIKFTPVKLEK